MAAALSIQLRMAPADVLELEPTMLATLVELLRGR
jgi:hypothetical protein